MHRYQIVRTHISPYQSQDFLTREKALISGQTDCFYSSLESYQNDLDTILITNTHTRLRDLPAKLLKQTKLIIHPNSGYDHFEDDHDLCKNIPLVVGHTVRAQAVAEYSLAALFEGLVELPQHVSWDKNRNWNRRLIKDTDIWIFGHGHIGKLIADTLKVLGAKITIVDPYQPERLAHWKDGKLNEARVIISAMSLNKTSQHYFNEEFFQHLGQEVLFINGARGKLVDEKALKGYLLSNPNSFAFLDVFEQEPFGEEWHGFPQVWKTSHIAGVERDLDQRILDFEVHVLKDFLALSVESFKKKFEKELLQNKWIKGVLV